MATAITDSSSAQEKPTATKKSLSFFLLLTFIIAIIGYFFYNNFSNSFINHNFYRVLYESSDKLNVNLTKLTRMLESNESTSSIRSQLPSYKELTQNIANEKISNSDSAHQYSYEFSYELKGDEILIYRGKNKETLIKYSKVSIFDVLPNVKEGFSQYILADKNGNVLTSNGGEKTISFVNLDHISKQISEQKTLLDFSNKKLETKTSSSTLPSYSSHIDMTLSYGQFRIFVFPFKLSTQLKNSTQIFESLYLVALLPKQKLSITGTGHWNISLLIVMSVSLLSTVAMLRLFLLPQNHSITLFFRYFVIGNSYIFFITITALFYAYSLNLSLQNVKDDKADSYIQDIVKTLESDIEKVFTGLDKYRSFYIRLLESTNNKAIQLPIEETRKNTAHLKKLQLSSIATINKEIPLPISHNDIILCKAILATISESHKITKHDDNITKISSIDCVKNYLTLVSNYERSKENTLSFYSKYIKVMINKKDNYNSKNNEHEIETYLKNPQEKSGYFPDNILNILVVNKFANSALPSIYYRENNALPKTTNVSHRAYYKNIRDNKAYDLVLKSSSKKFNNVYIQRLRNISNGSRGTTISMPLYTAEYLNTKKGKEISSKTIEESKSYVMAADVLLPSIDFGKPLKGNDFTYMVVDRNSGKVLFHSDESRSMVENLFYSGDNQSSLAQSIKAGLDIEKDKNKIISGHYHGQPGRFFIKSTIIPSWSVVVFYPKDSLDALMTSQFIYIFTCALSLMCLFILLYFIPKWLVRHLSKYDEKQLFPKAYNRNLFLILSIVIYLGFGYHIISIMNAESINSSTVTLSQLLYAINFILITVLLTFIYSRITVNKPIHWNIPIRLSEIKGFGFFNRFIILVFIILLVQLSFLSVTANLPIKSLISHYHKGYCQQMNLENQELAQKALILFPNSITQHSFKANDIMKPYSPKIASSSAECNEAYSEIKPGDNPNQSTLLGTQNFWLWIGSYLSEENNNSTLSTKVDFNLHNSEQFASYAFFILFLLGWIEFNRQVLWRRLYCPTKMLQHIQNLTESVKVIESDSRNERLAINCQGIRLNGVDLTYLLNTQTILKSVYISQEDSTEFDLVEGIRIQTCFIKLFSMSAFLQTFTSQNRALPNLKIDITATANEQTISNTLPLLDIDIWDIEVCLDEPEHRQHLLALIMEFKSLVLSKKVNSFTIYAGFHSLQRVEMKNLLSIEYSSLLEHTEYLSWAECLMDFRMIIPISFKNGIDHKILDDELACFPELSHLISKPFSSPSHKEKYKEKEMFFGDPLIPRSISEWSTMKYILLHAEPIYRFKWELCTSAEKLALFNLAKRRRLNPENTKMIEHLALNGLIKVEDDHLALVNKSFAQFVLYAETNETIAELERTGEHGVWKSYRVPIALLIVLIIGGVAMTSGQSIYIIAASLLGIITTIASVTNSANLLKNQFK
ncbi:MAG: hypothetical protein ACI87J_002044 [Colwellia sp.]|jgi:hypothetical protein